jgi:hypothetical protein
LNSSARTPHSGHRLCPSLTVAENEAQVGSRNFSGSEKGIDRRQ